MTQNEKQEKSPVTYEELAAKLDNIVALCGGAKSKDIADSVAEIKEQMRRKYGEN